MDSEILGATVGDNFQIMRSIDNIPDGETVSKAWFTVKTSLSLPDSYAKLQKVITEADVVGTGLIENSSPLGSADLRFDLSGADWDNLLGGKLYRYDIQILTSADGIYTVERGTFLANEQSTRATS